MIIDFHTHTFPDKIASGTVEHLKQQANIKAFSDGTKSRLREGMKKAGIDRSVVLPVATAARQVFKINEYAAAQNELFEKNGIFSLGCIHPDYEDYREELARISARGMKGIKLHPVYQGADIDSIRFLRIIDRAAELGLIVITHAGYDIGCPGVVHASPAMCRHVVQEIGSFPFILAHMGGWRCWDEVPGLLADTGVYLDTAFSADHFIPLQKESRAESRDTRMLDAGQFMKLIRAFGADHILFGTDSPWSDQETSVSFIRSLPLTGTELDQILGENAASLLGWTKKT